MPADPSATVRFDVAGTELFRELVSLVADLAQALPPEQQGAFVRRLHAITNRAEAEHSRAHIRNLQIRE